MRRLLAPAYSWLLIGETEVLVEAAATSPPRSRRGEAARPRCPPRMAVVVAAMLLLGVRLAAAAAHPHAAVNIEEPHPWLSGANASGAPAVVASPDPFVGTTWGAGTNATVVQLYNATKFERWESAPAAALAVVSNAGAGGVSVAVHAPGSVMIDFGVERAGWVEFASADLAAGRAAAAGRLQASISEYNEPYDGKTKPVVAYLLQSICTASLSVCLSV